MPGWEYRYERSVKVVRAAVTPEGKVPLDVNWQNNSLSLRQKKMERMRPELRWVEMFCFFLHPRK